MNKIFLNEPTLMDTVQGKEWGIARVFVPGGGWSAAGPCGHWGRWGQQD